MEKLSDLKEAQDDAFRKIGRNVTAFQQMEAILKFLIAIHKIEAPPQQLLESLRNNLRAVDRHTMGRLADAFFNSVHTDNSSSNNEQTAADGARSFSFSIDPGEAGIVDSKNALLLVIEERNLLIHKMLANVDWSSVDACYELTVVLDEQRDKIKSQYEYLRSLVGTARNSHRDLVEYLVTEEFSA